eukprot:SAG11_NODE_1657_length_4501_cov_2.957065_1_plen_305_part_00
MYVNRNATLMRAACRRAMLFYVVQLLALPSGFGGSPASFGSCAQCVEAGFGWSERLGRCGMFKNQACATPTTIPQPPQRVSPPITTPGPATEISVQVYDGPTDCAPSQRARNGHWVRAHYTGVIEYCPKRGPDRQKNRHCSLLRGSEFGSSRKDGHAAYDFQLGVESVIKGWDVGIVDLCKGARATLVRCNSYLSLHNHFAGASMQSKQKITYSHTVATDHSARARLWFCYQTENPCERNSEIRCGGVSFTCSHIHWQTWMYLTHSSFHCYPTDHRRLRQQSNTASYARNTLTSTTGVKLLQRP